MNTLSNLSGTQTLAKKTLAKLSLRVGIVIVAITVLSYLHVTSVSTEQALKTLEQYVTERGAREQIIFDVARKNHQHIKNAVLDRLAFYKDVNPWAKFQQRYVRFPDGVIRDRLEGFDGRRQAFAYIGKDVDLNTETANRILAFRDVVNQFGPAIRAQFDNLYITTTDCLTSAPMEQTSRIA